MQQRKARCNTACPMPHLLSIIQSDPKLQLIHSTAGPQLACTLNAKWEEMRAGVGLICEQWVSFVSSGSHL
jgi:hypothetical protein